MMHKRFTGSLKQTVQFEVFAASIEEANECVRAGHYVSASFETELGEDLGLKEIEEAAEDKKDVHTEHCCIHHGCKYRDSDCTVITKKVGQSGPCEDCMWEQGDFF